MYTRLSLSEAINNSKYKDYKLCYIDTIDKTYSDYTKESKLYLESEEFKKDKELFGWNLPKIQSETLINKDYIPGIQEYIAYFTPQNLTDQWGDDWNDIPYEHNAGIPYDEDKEILEIPFSIPTNYNIDQLFFKFPSDYGYNSFWSVEDINFGAIPWIFVRFFNKSFIFNSGISPLIFINLLKQIYNSIGDYLTKIDYKNDLEYLGLFNCNNQQVHAILNKNSDYIYLFDYNSGLPTNIINKNYDDIVTDSFYVGDWKRLNYIKISKEIDKEILDYILLRYTNPIKYLFM